MHIKKDMSRFYDKLKKDQEARRNPEKPYFFVAPDILRKKVASYQQQQRESRKLSKATLTNYDRTLTKSIEAAQKKKRAGKGVAQLGQQSHQSVPPLVVGNEYGSNLGLMHQAHNLRMSIWITLVNLLKRLVSTFTRCLVMETLRVRRRLIFGRKNLY